VDWFIFSLRLHPTFQEYEPTGFLVWFFFRKVPGTEYATKM